MKVAWRFPTRSKVKERSADKDDFKMKSRRYLSRNTCKLHCFITLAHTGASGVTTIQWEENVRHSLVSFLLLEVLT
jgi:hypothetical protein